MAITASAIGAIIGRWNNKKVVPQTYLAAPIVGEGVLKKKFKPNKRGTINIKGGGLEAATINIKGGGLEATKNVADGGSLPVGASKTIAQVTYDPVGIFTRLDIPRIGAAISQNPEDGVDVVLEQMDSAAEDLGRQLGRGIFKSSLGSPAVGTSASATTFTIADPSGLREGMSVDVHDASDVFVETITITDVNIPTSGNSTITFHSQGDSSAGATSAWTTSYTFYLQGGFDEALVSLTDVCANATLYGKAVATDDWRGNLDSTTTTFTVEALRSLYTRVKRRAGTRTKVSHVVLNEVNEERFYEAQDDEIRYVGGTIDQYGLKPAFMGKPIFVDTNCPDTDIFLFDDSAGYLHVYREFAPDMDGAKKGGMQRAAVVLSDDKLSYDCQVWGAMQGRWERRNCFGHMNALTA